MSDSGRVWGAGTDKAIEEQNQRRSILYCKRVLTGPCTFGNVNDVDVVALILAFKTLAKMVNDAKPIVEREALMLEDISRHAPLPSQAQAEHDSQERASETWGALYAHIMQS